MGLIPIENIQEAAYILDQVAINTPLIKSINFSEAYGANIYFKREDLQVVRSYKLRGAYVKMKSLSPQELKNGIVCASAGNHAQGVAYACNLMKVKGTIFMPATTPSQKVNQVKMFGKEWVDTKLFGDTYDDSFNAAKQFEKENNSTFVHPFDDQKVIEGQGTVGLEILKDSELPIDYLLFGIGGGGLASGVSSVFKALSPKTKLIGVEPTGSPSMKSSFTAQKVVALEHIDKFVDGAAVKKVGDLTYKICKEQLDDILLVDEGKVCSVMLDLYNNEAMVVEPAGALSIAALDQIKDQIKGKNVVCLIGGGNNDITRTEEIRERSLIYEGLKHYFIIQFPQRAGAMKEFLNNALGPTDDIVFFEYSKKTAKESGPALVGIVIKQKEDFDGLISRLSKAKVQYTYINDKPDIMDFLV